MIDQELQKYYEDRFTLFSTKGWKDLMEDADTMLDSYNDVTNIETTETFWQRRGYVELLTWLTNLEQVSKATYEDIINDEKNI